MGEMYASKKSRKQFRNIGLADLIRYRLPWSGKISILHRISGFFLFALLWLMLGLLEVSLYSEFGFSVVREWFSYPVVTAVFLLFVWCYFYHFCAGIRFLFLDLHVGVSKGVSRASAMFVFFASFILTGTLFIILFA